MLTDHKLSNVEASGVNWANVVPVHLISDATSAEAFASTFTKPTEYMFISQGKA